VCGVAVPDPARAAVTKEPAPVAPLRRAAQGEWSQEDDGKPYRVDGLDAPLCPGCERPLEEGAAACLRCGFNLRTGKKATQVFQPVERRWDGSFPLKARVGAALAFQAAAAPFVFYAASSPGHFGHVMACWFFSLLMTAFLLGTFLRVDLSRTHRGTLTLFRTWHVAFYPLPAEEVDLRKYEGITTGKSHDVDFSDYVVLCVLTLFFILPGVLWFFIAMHSDSYYVALNREHGVPDLVLFRGWSYGRMEDMEQTLRNAIAPVYSWYT
jgi:hypothetical protein